MENLRSLHTENLSNEILLSVLDEIKGLREDLKGLGDKPIKRALDVKDKKAIKEAIESGENVVGAEIVGFKNINIK